MKKYLLTLIFDIEPRESSQEIQNVMDEFGMEGRSGPSISVHRGRLFVFLTEGIVVASPTTEEQFRRQRQIRPLNLILTHDYPRLIELLQSWLDVQALNTGVPLRLSIACDMVAAVDELHISMRLTPFEARVADEKAREISEMLSEATGDAELVARHRLLRLSLRDYSRSLDERGPDYLVYLYRSLEALRNIVAGVDPAGRPRSDHTAWDALASASRQPASELKDLTDAANGFVVHARHAAADPSRTIQIDNEQRTRQEDLVRRVITGVMTYLRGDGQQEPSEKIVQLPNKIGPVLALVADASSAPEER